MKEKKDYGENYTQFIQMMALRNNIMKNSLMGDLQSGAFADAFGKITSKNLKEKNSSKKPMVY
jgi:hypothetical protein